MTPQEEQRWYAVYRIMNGQKSFSDFQKHIIQRLVCKSKTEQVGWLQTLVTHGHSGGTVTYDTYRYYGKDERVRIRSVAQTMNMVYKWESMRFI